MKTLIHSLMVMAALGLALSSAQADARFGKRSGGSPSGGGYSGGYSGGGSSYHAAGGVNQPAPSGSYYSGSSAYRPYPGAYGYGYRPHSYWPGYYNYYGWGFGYRPLLLAPAPVIVASEAPAAESAPSSVSASFSATGMLFGSSSGSGTGFDVGAAFEGERLGVDFNLTGLYVPADDGSGGTDSIKLMNAMLTYAIISRPEGRLRIEGGAMSAFAPEVVMMGPGVGVSGVLGLIGPLSAEASMKLTPFPYRQVDAQAGLTLGLGPLGFRGGYRVLYLNDNGAVDGVAHEDLFSGPYVGLQLVM